MINERQSETDTVHIRYRPTSGGRHAARPPSSIIAQPCLAYVYLSLSSFFLPERVALLLLSSLWNISLGQFTQLSSSSILVYF